MDYSFEILGVSPLLSFFNHQQERQEQPESGAAYLGAPRCTLDAFIDSVGSIPRPYEWNLDRVVDSVIQFWMTNAESVQHWRSRLEDAGNQSVIVARVADVNALRSEFEHIFQRRML